MKVFKDLHNLELAVEEAYSIEGKREMLRELMDDLQNWDSFIAIDRLLKWIDEADTDIATYTKARADDIEESRNAHEAEVNAEYWDDRIKEKKAVQMYARQVIEDLKQME